MTLKTIISTYLLLKYFLSKMEKIQWNARGAKFGISLLAWGKRLVSISRK